MATKRSFSDVHPSRREQVPQASRKRQKPDNLGSKSFKKAHPVNDLKTRARNVARLLARTDDKLPAHIRVAKERELQTVQYELKESQAADKKSKLIARYHHIRFFERQKATRGLKKAKKRLAALASNAYDEERDKIQQEVEDCELDINYTTYYPLDRPYHSLYPREKDDGADQDISVKPSRGDLEIRKLVKQCMADGRLQALRDGAFTADLKDEPSPSVLKPSAAKREPKTAKATRASDHGKLSAVEPGEEDDNSDGGFFE